MAVRAEEEQALPRPGTNSLIFEPAHVPAWNTENLADAVVHIAGLVFALAACVTLVFLGHQNADPTRQLALAFYGFGLVAMFLCSALYNLTGSRNEILRRLDHAAIFLMIAGTYAPVTLITATGTRGHAVFAVVAGVAVIAAIAKLVIPNRFGRLSIPLYLLLGWVILADIGPLVAAIPLASSILLAMGAVLYSVGVVFHVWARLRYQNAIWHGFVLVAAACHFAAIVSFAAL